MDLEGILAIGGFWLVILVLVLKKPISNLIERSKLHDKEVAELNDKINKLEGLVNSVTEDCNRVNKELSELKESSDFSYRMLIEHQRTLENVQSQQTVTVLPGSPQSIPSRTATNGPRMLNTNAPQAADFGKVLNEHTIRFERTFPTTPERLFKYITDSQYLNMWLAEGDIEEHFGGRVNLTFDSRESPGHLGSQIGGLVSHCEPNKSIAFSWIDTANQLESIVSIELVESGNETKMILTHSRLAHSTMHEMMAAWHARFDVLLARLRNIMPPDFMERFRDVIQVYITMVATVTICATPVSAATGGGDYQSISLERSHLMAKYDELWREVDTLQKDMSLLKKDSSNESRKSLDALDGDLKDHYRDLQQLEFQIRDLDRALKS